MKNILYSKFLIILLSVLLVSGSVLAFFVFDYNRAIDFQVVGAKGNLTVTVDLTNQIFNVSQNLSSTQNLTILNQNGATQFLYLINTNLTGVEPACDPTGDVSFQLTKFPVTPLNNGTTFTMNPGFNDFKFIVSAVNDRVCPQNITVTLDFSEV